MNSRFLQPLKISTVIGIVFAFNDAVFVILNLTLNTHVWQVDYFIYFQNEKYMFYFDRIYSPIWTVFYTFGGCILRIVYEYLKLLLINFFIGMMDIVITYERVQMIFPKMIILAKFSILKIASVAFVFSVLVNIPVNVAREVHEQVFRIDSNETIILRYLSKNFCIKLTR